MSSIRKRGGSNIDRSAPPQIIDQRSAVAQKARELPASDDKYFVSLRLHFDKGYTDGTKEMKEMKEMKEKSQEDEASCGDQNKDQWRTIVGRVWYVQ